MPAPHISAEQLVQHQDWLFRMVRQLVRDDFTAEDMVQATMTEAIADDSAGATNLRGWLGSTARRLTAQHWRSGARREDREQRVGLNNEVVLRKSSELTEMFDIANRALHELPEEERVAVMMRHMQAMKPSEVAMEMGVPVEQVYRHTENGTKKLRDRLETRYGRDWRSNCLAILALPGVKKGAYSLVPLAASVAVCLTLLAGGFYAFDLFGEDAPHEVGPDLAGTSTANASASGSSALQPSAPQRSNLPLLSQGTDGVHCRVVDPEGLSHASAQVIAIWKRGWYASTEGITDQDGYLTLSPPEDAEDLRLIFGGDGTFGISVPVPPEARGDLQVLQLVEGTIPVSFLAVGAPAGEVIEVKGRAYFGLPDTLLGTCITDEEGIARLNLPAAGHYIAKCRSAGKGLPGSAFHVDSSGILTPIPVPYRLHSSYKLVAQDARGGQTLDQARYLITTFTDDGLVSQPVQSDRGHLFLDREFPLGFSTLIHVQADGYQDIFAKFNAPVAGETELPMLKLEMVPASIHLADTRRTIVSLTLFDAYRTISLPDRNGTGGIDISPAVPIPLSIENDGTFSMPRAIGWLGHAFRLEAVDDLGETWSSELYGPNDRSGQTLAFEIPPKPTGRTTVKILGTKPASASVQYECSSIVQGAIPMFFAEPDESGTLHFETYPGTGLEIDYSAQDLRMTVRPQLPDGIDSGDFRCTIPDPVETLSGTMYGPEGLLLPDGSVFPAKYLESVPVLGPGVSEHATIEYYGEVVDGQAILENCPAGRYSISLSYQGLQLEYEVRTSEPFEIRFPECHVVSLRVLDEETGAPLGAVLCDTASMNSLGYPTEIHSSDSGSGFLAKAFRLDYPRSHLVVAKWYYEPEVVRSPGSDELTTIRLKPGRFVRVDLEDFGLAVTEGNTWICDTWGGAEDPRQPFVRFTGTKVHTVYAPRHAFYFLEVDAEGRETDRAFLIHEDGTAELR